jgi:hypothetical protein
VLDTRTGDRSVLQMGAGCVVADGRHGYFLVNCPTVFAGHAPYVLNARRRLVFQVPGADRTWDTGEEFFSAIGTRWLWGHGHNATPVYLEWRTGHGTAFGDDDGPPTRDLDSPNLALLAPGVVGRFGRSTLLQPGPSLFPSVVLRRPGRRDRVLDGCYPGGCTSASIGPRAVVWTRGTAVHEYSTASGRRFHWTFRLLGVGLMAQATAYRLFVDVPRSSDPSDGIRVEAAALPR